MFLFLFLLERDETAKRGIRRGNANYTGSSVTCEHVFASCECLLSSCLSVCISLFLSISLCMCLSLCLSVYVTLCFYVGVPLSVFLYVTLHMYFVVYASLSVSLVPCHYMCLSVDVFSMCICVGVSLYVLPLVLSFYACTLMSMP